MSCGFEKQNFSLKAKAVMSFIVTTHNTFKNERDSIKQIHQDNLQKHGLILILPEKTEK